MNERDHLHWCPHEGCGRHFTMQRGLTRHLRETHGAQHPLLDAATSPPPPIATVPVMEHPAIDALLALLPARDDYDYELVDDVGAAFARTLHAIYRSSGA